MKICAILAFFIGSATWAAIEPMKHYEVKMDLSVNGKLLWSPELALKEGRTATLNQKAEGDEVFIDVMAREDKAQEGILVKLTVGTVDPDGKWTLAHPEMLVHDGVPARLTVHKKNGETESVSLTVTQKKSI